MPIPAEIKKFLKQKVEKAKDNDFLFITNKKSRIIAEKKLRENFRKIKIKYKIEGFKFDDFINISAINMLKKGISIEHLYKRLGDYSIQATMEKYGGFIR